MNKIIFYPLLILIISLMVNAIPLVPQGDIWGKNIYAIVNFTDINGTRIFQNGTKVIDYGNMSSLTVNYSQYTNISHLNVNTSTLKTTGGLLDIVFSFFSNLFYTKTEIDSSQTAQNTSLSNEITNRQNADNNINTTSNIQNLGFYNTTIIDASQLAQNNTIGLKALPGTCTGSSVTQNTTTTGVQCYNTNIYNDTLIIDNSTIIRTFTNSAGDVSGNYSNLIVADDSHVHSKSTVTISGENITSGTVADARIDSTITRDTELDNSTIVRTSTPINWTTLQNYPVACVGTGSSQTYLTAVNDSTTCTSISSLNGNNIADYLSLTNSISYFVNRSLWTTIDNYPTACAGQVVSGIGDTLTCVDYINDTTASKYNNTLAINNVNSTVVTHTSQISGIQTNITNVNATANLKALPGTCSGQLVTQNTTTTGVQCYNASVFNDTAYADSLLIVTIYNASAITNVTGTSSGGISNITSYDSISYNVSEVNSDIDFRVNFTGITDFNQIIVRYKSATTESHTMDIALWDSVLDSWESYRTVGVSPDYNIMTMNVYDIADHIVSGIVQLRFYSSNVGSSTHNHQFDWVAISKGPATPSSSETDPYSIHKDGNVGLTGNWDAGLFNITASWFVGMLNWSNLQNTPSIGTSNLTLVEVVAGVGNWSADKTGIQANITSANATANTKAYPGTASCTGNDVAQNVTTTTAGTTSQCITVVTTDLNNYTSALSVDGTSTKTINLARIGMDNLTASFTDTGGVDTIWNITGSYYLANCTGILCVNGTTLNSTITTLASAFNETLRINSVNTSSNIQVLGFFNTTVIDATNTAQNNTILLEVGARAMNATVMTLVGARMVNGTLDAGITNINNTIASINTTYNIQVLKFFNTTIIDNTNTAQNNTLMSEVGARLMNATLYSYAGNRIVNGTLDAGLTNMNNSIAGINTSYNIQVLGFFNTTITDNTNAAQNNSVLLLVGARMMNGSLDLSLQGMNNTIGLKALTTVVDATNTAQNNSLTNVNATANLKALPGTANCTGSNVVQNVTTTTTGTTSQCVAMTGGSGGGTVNGSGTTNYLARWNGTNTINSSMIIDDGVNITFGTGTGTTVWTNTTINTTSFYGGALYLNGNNIQTDISSRMINGSLDLSLQGMNNTIGLKALTTVVDATNIAQNNTILLEVGARAMNATLMSEVGARAMNATVLSLVGARMLNETVNTLVGGRILNGTLLGAGNITGTTFGAGNYTFPSNITITGGYISVPLAKWKIGNIEANGNFSGICYNGTVTIIGTSFNLTTVGC